MKELQNWFQKQLKQRTDLQPSSISNERLIAEFAQRLRDQTAEGDIEEKAYSRIESLKSKIKLQAD